MKKFLFITHLTPRNRRSGLRSNLMEIMQRSLYEQNYSNWKGLWIGEMEEQNNKVKNVALHGDSREQAEQLRNIYERSDVREYVEDCDYVVKLDDDDVISKTALENAAKIDFDCYCDAYHTFYDVTSGTVTSEKRPWIASTAIHKKEHAFKKLHTDQPCQNFLDSLFYGEHGADWIKYYRDKNIVYATKSEPLYLRVLSPISYTAGAGIAPRVKLSDIDMNAYYEYLKQFGAWNEVKTKGFEHYIPQLDETWERFSGSPQKPISGIPLTKKLKRHLKDLLNG